MPITAYPTTPHLQRRLRRLHRSPRRVAFHFDGAAKELAAFGDVEPGQILAGKGDARNASVLRRVQNLGDAAVGFANLNPQRGREVDLTDGVFRDSLDAAHPTRL